MLFVIVNLLLPFVKGTGGNESTLVHTLGMQLYECTTILQLADNFHDSHHESDERRRTTSEDEAEDDETNPLIQGVAQSLDTCLSVVEAVNTFYQNFEAVGKHRDGIGAWTDPIDLNVGGTHFLTTLATLRSRPHSYFGKMFSKNSTTCSSDGSFFIDRDSSTFRYILDYLREGDLLVESGDEILRQRLYSDAKYYNLTKLFDYLRWSSLSEGMSLSYAEFTFLDEELDNYRMGGLFFQASVDGDRASTFHSKCNSEGATLTIVETTAGYMFGGYTRQSWDNSGGCTTDPYAFVFQLRPVMSRCSVSPGGSCAIYRSSSYGPVFGWTNIRIADYATSTAQNYLSSSYYDSGCVNGRQLNGGSEDFRVKDYAVVNVL